MNYMTDYSYYYIGISLNILNICANSTKKLYKL